MVQSEADVANTKTHLLQELNDRRRSLGKLPLTAYPEAGCIACGEIPHRDVPLIDSRVSYIRTCQPCLLKQYPFNRLVLPAGEKISWYRSNPTFHRSGDYGLVVTDQSLYLYSPLLLLFARWRRIALTEIRGASFVDSKLFPAIHIQTNSRESVLRTPWDYGDEMQHDRTNLKEAVERIQTILASTHRV